MPVNVTMTSRLPPLAPRHSFGLGRTALPRSPLPQFGALGRVEGAHARRLLVGWVYAPQAGQVLRALLGLSARTVP